MMITCSIRQTLAPRCSADNPTELLHMLSAVFGLQVLTYLFPNGSCHPCQFDRHVSLLHRGASVMRSFDSHDCHLIRLMTNHNPSSLRCIYHCLVVHVFALKSCRPCDEVRYGPIDICMYGKYMCLGLKMEVYSLV